DKAAAPAVRRERGLASARKGPLNPEGNRSGGREPAPVALEHEIERFLSSAAFADTTRRSYRFDLVHFARWLEARRLGLEDVGMRELAGYAADLGRGRSRLAPASIARRIAAVRSLLRYTLGPARVPEAALGPR